MKNVRFHQCSVAVVECSVIILCIQIYMHTTPVWCMVRVELQLSSCGRPQPPTLPPPSPSRANRAPAIRRLFHRTDRRRGGGSLNGASGPEATEVDVGTSRLRARSASAQRRDRDCSVTSPPSATPSPQLWGVTSLRTAAVRPRLASNPVWSCAFMVRLMFISHAADPSWRRPRLASLSAVFAVKPANWFCHSHVRTFFFSKDNILTVSFFSVLRTIDSTDWVSVECLCCHYHSIYWHDYDTNIIILGATTIEMISQIKWKINFRFIWDLYAYNSVSRQNLVNS